jgi:hypothetical protein
VDIVKLEFSIPGENAWMGKAQVQFDARDQIRFDFRPGDDPEVDAALDALQRAIKSAVQRRVGRWAGTPLERR